MCLTALAAQLPQPDMTFARTINAVGMTKRLQFMTRRSQWTNGPAYDQSQIPALPLTLLSVSFRIPKKEAKSVKETR